MIHIKYPYEDYMKLKVYMVNDTWLETGFDEQESDFVPSRWKDGHWWLSDELTQNLQIIPADPERSKSYTRIVPANGW